jgi:hypothetical protein
MDASAVDTLLYNEPTVETTTSALPKTWLLTEARILRQGTHKSWTMRSRPINAIIAIALSLLPLPALKLLEHLNRGCGDGLCGFFSGLLILGGLAAASLMFVVRSTRQAEAPALLRVLPFILWALILVPLVR